ncbi:MAG: sigma-70 family RNA polymerase sigma factor [Planctomycetota bacterium]
MVPQRAGFAALFDAFYPLALNYTYRRVRERGLAEELVESAFVHMLEAFERPSARRAAPPEQPETQRAWVYRVLTNEIHRHFRATRNARLRLRLWRERRRAAAPAAPASPAAAAEQADDFERISAALAEIGEKYAAVLALRYFEQLRTREIAEILETTESTVRTRIERGLTKLRVRLAPEAPAAPPGR